MATLTRKQREIQQREALILNVARAMLIEGGYLGLNMDRIAETTEYSKGTIYQHFSSKEEIMIALCIQSLEIQMAFFERAATFQGRTRERMLAIAEAYELFVRLYPHHVQNWQTIHSASIHAKTSAERQSRLQVCEHHCLSIVSGVIRDAIAQGNLVLPAWSSPEKLTFGLWSIAFGAYMIMASGVSLDAFALENPRDTLHGNYRFLLDGVGWQPLSSAWDYEPTYERIRKEVFANEYRQVETG